MKRPRSARIPTCASRPSVRRIATRCPGPAAASVRLKPAGTQVDLLIVGFAVLQTNLSDEIGSFFDSSDELPPEFVNRQVLNLRADGDLGAGTRLDARLLHDVEAPALQAELHGLREALRRDEIERHARGGGARLRRPEAARRLRARVEPMESARVDRGGWRVLARKALGSGVVAASAAALNERSRQNPGARVPERQMNSELKGRRWRGR